MTHKIIRLKTLPSLISPVHLELLEALLEPEDSTYPWNPADEESEAYFHQIEQQFGFEDLLGSEFTAHSPDFYAYLDTLWTHNTIYYNSNTEISPINHLQEILHSTFSASVPQQLLQAIAQKAIEIFPSPKSTGEKLVECVQGLLPNWVVEDLQVLSRPFAQAMRSSEQQNLESVITKITAQHWEELSATEQAKYSLAIAYYALIELNSWRKEV